MPVYLIIDVTIIDPEVYAEYVEKAPAVVEKYGGTYLARDGRVLTMAGGWHPQRIVLVEFDSIEQVQECFASPEYLALAPLREQSSTSRSIIIEGYEP
jgi:uncharacterized protein (DUF1330 family)